MLSSNRQQWNKPTDKSWIKKHQIPKTLIVSFLYYTIFKNKLL